MGYIPSVEIAYLMVFISTICWGSWANAIKRCGDWRFEAFYWDYALSLVLWTFLLGRIFGGLSFQISSTAFWLANFSGFVWGIGNILLVAAIALAGFAVAFPLGVGIALVLGTFLAFFTNPSATHNPLALFLGLAAVSLGIIANGIAYKAKEKKASQNQYFKRGLLISIFAGILIALFPFPFNYAFKAGLNGYTAAFLMATGSVISTLIVLPIIMKKPLIPGQLSIGAKEYFRAKASWHLWGILAGLVWSIGTVFNLVVASQPKFSVAIAYTIGNCAPMVAALWGIFVWKEFKGAERKTYKYLVLMFVAFIVGILLLANAAG